MALSQMALAIDEYPNGCFLDPSSNRQTASALACEQDRSDWRLERDLVPNSVRILNGTTVHESALALALFV